MEPFKCDEDKGRPAGGVLSFIIVIVLWLGLCYGHALVRRQLSKAPTIPKYPIVWGLLALILFIFSTVSLSGKWLVDGSSYLTLWEYKDSSAKAATSEMNDGEVAVGFAGFFVVVGWISQFASILIGILVIAKKLPAGRLRYSTYAYVTVCSCFWMAMCIMAGLRDDCFDDYDHAEGSGLAIMSWMFAAALAILVWIQYLKGDQGGGGNSARVVPVADEQAQGNAQQQPMVQNVQPLQQQPLGAII